MSYKYVRFKQLLILVSYVAKTKEKYFLLDKIVIITKQCLKNIWLETWKLIFNIKSLVSAGALNFMVWSHSCPQWRHSMCPLSPMCGQLPLLPPHRGSPTSTLGLPAIPSESLWHPQGNSELKFWSLDTCLAYCNLIC